MIGSLSFTYSESKIAWYLFDKRLRIGKRGEEINIPLWLHNQGTVNIPHFHSSSIVNYFNLLS